MFTLLILQLTKMNFHFTLMSSQSCNSGESSNETEIFNVSMEGGEDESFVLETAHGLPSCVDCSTKQERIENLKKLRSKLKRRNLMLRKENTKLQKVCCNELYSRISSCDKNMFLRYFPGLDTKSLNFPNFKPCISC